MQVIVFQVLSNSNSLQRTHFCLNLRAKAGVHNNIKLTHWALLPEKTAKRILTLEAISLHSAWAGPEMDTEDSRQIFRHLTGNGWALDNMNSIRCLETQEELFAQLQSSIIETA